MIDHMSEETYGKKVTIGELTKVQLGIVVILLGGFASWIWWAATISTKLDSVLKFQQSQDVSIMSLRRDLDGLRTDFEVHKAQTTTIKP